MQALPTTKLILSIAQIYLLKQGNNTQFSLKNVPIMSKKRPIIAVKKERGAPSGSPPFK